MNEPGLNTVRIGEFAWSAMKHREGNYNFDWLHEAISKLNGAWIAVILCTPTCTPPAWRKNAYLYRGPTRIALRY